MDFRDLQYVIAVADCGSITEAAKKLYISQPSLSYIISKIEQDIGVLPGQFCVSMTICAGN